MLAVHVVPWCTDSVHEGVQGLEGVMGRWQLRLAWAGPVSCAQHCAWTQPALPVHAKHVLQGQKNNTTGRLDQVKRANVSQSRTVHSVAAVRLTDVQAMRTLQQKDL